MSYNEWLYGYNNPVTYTDPDGKQPINDGNGEELTKEEIKKLFDENPHEVLELLQQQFKIQLPDGYYFRITTGWDIHRWNYSTIYGVEWWFAEYGNLVGTIYEHSDIQCSVFTTSIPSQAKHIDYSVYITKHAISDWKYYPDDIAAIMIHEAVHAWQENVTRGYVVNPGQENDPSSAEWHGKYGNGMERQAVDYVFAANNSDRIDASPRMIWRSLTFRVGRSFGKDFPYTLPPGVP